MIQREGPAGQASLAVDARRASGHDRAMSADARSWQHLLVKREGPITTITLNRPEKRNALSLEVMLELTDAFRDAGSSDASGVVLAANGPVFSAGHNFGDLLGAPLAEVRRLFSVCTAMMDAVQEIPQPVVAKVHALATAAGCQLVATCDLAVASEEAAFAIPGGKGGLFCHTPLVAVGRSVGRKRALELALTGDAIDARTAADWGLVNKVVPAAELDDATHDLISRATRGSILSKSLGKQGFYAQIDLDQDKAYAYAIELMSSASQIRDAQEAFAAFLEKRHPHFEQR
jgi:enoyl-CoA hydratase/carnithine racemase